MQSSHRNRCPRAVMPAHPFPEEKLNDTATFPGKKKNKVQIKEQNMKDI